MPGSRRTNRKTSSKSQEMSNSGESASISGSSSAAPLPEELTLEELNHRGDTCYFMADYDNALSFYEEAVAIYPFDGKSHRNKAHALVGLKQFTKAIKAYEEAIILIPTCFETRKRFGRFLISLGQTENARKQLYSLGREPDQVTLQMFEAVVKHIEKCTEARRVKDWKTMLNEAKEATTSEADSSHQLFACQAEAHLKLHQLNEAEKLIAQAKKHDPVQFKFFGMLTEAYVLFVKAQIDISLGKFDPALSAIEKAARVDSESAEVKAKLKNIGLVYAARKLGNKHFGSKRYAQACKVYGEGLLVDSSNSLLYYNRANCWSKLGEWEKSLADSNCALQYYPQYTKALYLKAASNIKLKKWADAVRDYEILRKKLPSDEKVAENLSHARVELMKSGGEVEGKVELVSDLDKFRAAIASGASVVYFDEESNPECTWMSYVMDTLSAKYHSVTFLKVDMKQSPAIATEEKITVAPTFKLYKDDSCKEDTNATLDSLEFLIKDTLLDSI